MITQKSIEEVRFAARIEEVVGEHLTLKRQGSSFVCICPFHNDKNPSMHVTPRLGIYKCFVCGEAGDSLKFLMEYAKMSYPEAIEHLAEKYNITLEYEKQSEEFKEQNSERESLFLVNEFAKNWFMEQLRTTEEGKLIGMSYFKEKRQFKEATIDKFQLGYCPDGWDTFTQAALKQGYKEEYLLKLGLTKKSEKGKLYDFYRGRVIFPIHNTIGKVIGFGGRKLKEDGKNTPKYYNSPENEIYHKSDTLYDIYLAKRVARKADNVFLVEGYTDVISMFEAGVENVVASSGTALTDGQVKLITSLTNNVTVLYDGDAAGIHAALRGTDMLLKQGLSVRVCLLPDGEDPDSFAKTHRDSEFQDYVTEHAVDFIAFKAEVLNKEAGKDPLKRANVVNDVLQSIAKVQDVIAQQFYLKTCSEIFGISEEMLGRSLRSIVWADRVDDKKGGKQEPQKEIYNPINAKQLTPKENRPGPNLLYMAEKNLVLMLLKYGMYEIRVASEKDDNTFVYQRVDQYVFNEMYADFIILEDPVLRKLYDEYASIVDAFRDQTEIQRYFLLNEDSLLQEFTARNLDVDGIMYSSQWEKKFDMYTHFADNNILNLQQEVQNNLLTLKLRVVEKKVLSLTKEMQVVDDSGNPIYSDEEILDIVDQINRFNKLKKEIAVRLNRVISN